MESSTPHPGPVETGTVGAPVEAGTEDRASPNVAQNTERNQNATSATQDAITEPAPAYTPNPNIAENQPTETKAVETQQPKATPMEAKPTAPQAVARVTPLNLLGAQPAWIDCPFCERRALTRVTTEDSSTTMLASLLCCLICICLVCVPQMAGMCQNTNHFCTNCNNRVAHKPHDGQTYAIPPASSQFVVSKHPPAVNQTSGTQPAQSQQPKIEQPTTADQ